MECLLLASSQREARAAHNIAIIKMATPADFGKDRPMPDADGASFLSRVTYRWLDPLLTTAHKRNLTYDDLYLLSEPYRSLPLADRVDQSYDELRRSPSRNLFSVDRWLPARWRKSIASDGAPSLISVLNACFGKLYWTAFALEVIGEMLQLLSPLLVRELIDFSSRSYSNRFDTSDMPSIGIGIGLSIGLFLMQALAAFFREAAYWHANRCGSMAIGALSASIYRRLMSISWRDRSDFGAARILVFLSNDVGKLEMACVLVFESLTLDSDCAALTVPEPITGDTASRYRAHV